MFDLSQLQGLFGGSPPQMTDVQGMGMQSPFFASRPQQGLMTQDFEQSRTNAMSPQAMMMMGMNPNMPNMVGPTSALPANMQPQASQLKMWGMEDQLANPPGIPQNPAATQAPMDQDALTQALVQQGLLIPNPSPQPFVQSWQKRVASQGPYTSDQLYGDYVSPAAREWLRLYGLGEGGG